jgi:hypothetical protein
VTSGSKMRWPDWIIEDPDITITTGSTGVAVLAVIAYDGSFRKTSGEAASVDTAFDACRSGKDCQDCRV